MKMVFTEEQDKNTLNSFYKLGTRTSEERLHDTIESHDIGKISKIKTILVRETVDIDYPDKKGYTVLYKAVNQGNGTLVKLLCEHGSNPYKKQGGILGFWQTTPYEEAEKKGLTGIVKIIDNSTKEIIEKFFDFLQSTTLVIAEDILKQAPDVPKKMNFKDTELNKLCYIKNFLVKEELDAFDVQRWELLKKYNFDLNAEDNSGLSLIKIFLVKSVPIDNFKGNQYYEQIKELCHPDIVACHLLHHANEFDNQPGFLNKARYFWKLVIPLSQEDEFATKEDSDNQNTTTVGQIDCNEEID